jgi:hypothetical protein
LFSVAIFINFRVYKNGQRISGIDKKTKSNTMKLTFFLTLLFIFSFCYNSFAQQDSNQSRKRHAEISNNLEAPKKTNQIDSVSENSKLSRADLEAYKARIEELKSNPENQDAELIRKMEIRYEELLKKLASDEK